MKILFSLILSLFCMAGQAQGLFRGNVILNAYAGYPNFLRLTMPTLESIPDNISPNYSGLAPSGLRFMYMATDDVSIGVDLMYGMAKASYTRNDSIFFNGNWDVQSTTYRIQKQRFRPQFRVDMHLGSRDPSLDQYIGLAFGGNFRTRAVWQNDTLVDQNPNDANFVIPVSFRACYGFRYFIDYNFSVGAELGVGGPLMQFALSYRI
jgi:hypothetical protein